MPIEVTEKQESRSYSDTDAALIYSILGTANATDARAALLSESPLTFGGLYRRKSKVEPVFVNTNDPGNSIWQGEVTYGVRAIPDTGESTFQFETGGGSQHITNSIQTIASYAPASGCTPGPAPNHKQAIGVTDDRVEGVDIVIPRYDWSETYYKADDDVDETYKLLVAALTGSMNDDTFRGAAAGEVLFLGASGQYRGGEYDDWEITYRFSYSPNKSNLTIGDITGINKLGWDYLWVSYKDDVDTNDFHVKVPQAVYIERVYPTGDFSALDIG